MLKGRPAVTGQLCFYRLATAGCLSPSSAFYHPTRPTPQHCSPRATSASSGISSKPSSCKATSHAPVNVHTPYPQVLLPPLYVNLMYCAIPLCLSLTAWTAQRQSRLLGRVPTMVLNRGMGIALLYWIATHTNVRGWYCNRGVGGGEAQHASGERTWALCTSFLEHDLGCSSYCRRCRDGANASTPMPSAPLTHSARRHTPTDHSSQHWQEPALMVPVYVARTSIMNSIYPLQKSILMVSARRDE